MMNMCDVARGDIIFVTLNGDGSMQRGDRPCLVVSNDSCNKYSPVIQVVTLTTKMNKKPLPTHKLIEKGIGNLKTASVALCETVTSLPKQNIKFKIGSLDYKTMEQINDGIMCQLGIA